MRSLCSAPLLLDSPLRLDDQAPAESAPRALYRIWDNPHYQPPPTLQTPRNYVHIVFVTIWNTISQERDPPQPPQPRLVFSPPEATDCQR